MFPEKDGAQGVPRGTPGPSTSSLSGLMHTCQQLRCRGLSVTFDPRPLPLRCSTEGTNSPDCLHPKMRPAFNLVLFITGPEDLLLGQALNSFHLTTPWFVPSGLPYPCPAVQSNHHNRLYNVHELIVSFQFFIFTLEPKNISAGYLPGEFHREMSTANVLPLRSALSFSVSAGWNEDDVQQRGWGCRCVFWWTGVCGGRWQMHSFCQKNKLVNIFTRL